MEFNTIKKSFFNLAVGDILRAMDGQSLVGSIILSLCVIDYIAYYTYDNTNKTRQKHDDFERVIESYLNQNPYIKKKYSPKWVWAVRCALAHTYATSNAFKDSAPYEGYRLIDSLPACHLTERVNKKGQKILILNFESFVCDVIWGTWVFFEQESNRQEIIERSEKLLVLTNIDNEEYYEAYTYRDMHFCLREFDNLSPIYYKLFYDISERLRMYKSLATFLNSPLLRGQT